jgi:serpin B
VKRAVVVAVIAVVALIALWPGCGDEVGAPIEEPRKELSEAATRLTESDNRFGLNLFGEIVGAEPERNIFISPLSVSMAFGMTFNGAGGETELAMRDVLEYGDLTGEEINQSYRDIIDVLSGLDPDVEFSIANSIWHRVELSFKREFLDVNRRYFDAEVTALNFGAPDAASIINGWVNEKTNGRIEEIVDDPIDPSLIMFLINAIYFKGAWTYEFDPEETYDGVFHLPDGSEGPCRMMAMQDTFSYQYTKDFQAVEMRYGRGDFSMVVLLPRKDLHVDDLIGMMSPENLKVWLQGFAEESIHYAMPKFTLEYEISLKDVLTAMGMGIAFDPGRADLRGLYEGFDNAYIDRVKHKTFVKVDEEGTEAAAVTSIGIGKTSMPPSMIVDRPFVFIIRDSHTNTVLFVGKVVEPLLE